MVPVRLSDLDHLKSESNLFAGRLVGNVLIKKRLVFIMRDMD
jgi:hypothetical protein